MHQSLCSPPILLLIKAINAGFLKGAPHLTTKTIARYPSPSLATSKGHMKQPCKGLRSTTPKQTRPIQPTLPRPPPAQSIHGQLMPGLIPDNKDDKLMPDLIPDDKNRENQPALITDVEGKSIANIFCFGAFANKNTGIVYNDCTGNFPFMSLDGNVCFFVMYHYETNTIFATQYLDWI